MTIGSIKSNILDIECPSFWLRPKPSIRSDILVDHALENMLGESIPCKYYHHTLSTYLNSAFKAGFKLDKIAEPRPTKKQIKQYGKLLDIRENVPQYILFRFIKG